MLHDSQVVWFLRNYLYTRAQCIDHRMQRITAQFQFKSLLVEQTFYGFIVDHDNSTITEQEKAERKIFLWKSRTKKRSRKRWAVHYHWFWKAWRFPVHPNGQRRQFRKFQKHLEKTWKKYTVSRMGTMAPSGSLLKGKALRSRSIKSSPKKEFP